MKSLHTHLLAVTDSRFHGIADLGHSLKIAVSISDSSPQWLQTALATYGISFVPILVPLSERFEALRRGVVDAILVTQHPSTHLKEHIVKDEIRLLPWSKPAIEAVTRAFPTSARVSVLPSNTYEGQYEEIQGYAPY